MLWVWVVVIVVLIGVLTVVFVGSGSSLAEVYDERPDKTIQVGGPLSADDVRDVTFTTAVRGYRMDEVDAFISRVEADLLAREAAAASKAIAEEEAAEAPAEAPTATEPAAEKRLDADPDEW